MTNTIFTQGDIWLASLNPQQKSEPGKIRPVLIIQNQYLLDANHSTTIVVPLTTNLIDDAEPLRIRIKAEDKLEKNSDLLIDQVRAIDNSRFIGSPLLNIGLNKLNYVIEALHQLIYIPETKD
ncbi:type II toxin-antitoxin system PemK/MazF family toxin [Holosporaceae bacterium 'Namur']|nr:type II toxin-antitoxin system PemK/MazF family toxin [Holosporaceae bacterium 'Namur']